MSPGCENASMTGLIAITGFSFGWKVFPVYSHGIKSRMGLHGRAGLPLACRNPTSWKLPVYP